MTHRNGKVNISISDRVYNRAMWLADNAVLCGIFFKAPVRMLRGRRKYRWIASYFKVNSFTRRCIHGYSGLTLRAARIQMHTVIKITADSIVSMLRGDASLGKTGKTAKQIVYEHSMGPEILAGFPTLEPVLLDAMQSMVCAYFDEELPQYYLDRSDDEACSQYGVAIGAAISDDIPKNGAAVIINHMQCASSGKNTDLIKDYFNLPTLVSMLPMRWDDPNTDKFALFQMKKLIKFIESETKESFDEHSFFAQIEKHNAEVALEKEQWDYMTSPYIPVSGAINSLFHTVIYSFSGGRLSRINKTQKKILSIAEKAYEQKINCFPKTRHRVLIWGAVPIYYFDLPNWLYNSWGALVVAEMDDFSGCAEIPTDNLDDALVGMVKSYERGILRRHMPNSVRDPIEVWNVAESMNCDIVITTDTARCNSDFDNSFESMGFTTGSVRLIELKCDLFDSRLVSRESIRQQINLFFTEEMQEKPLERALF